MGRAVFAQQRDILECCAAGAKTRGCFHPIRVQLSANLTQADLLSVIQVTTLKDDLYLFTNRMGDFDHFANIGANVIPVAAQRLADIDDHIQFAAAVLQGLHRFGHFYGGGMPAMGKADRGARFDIAFAEKRRATFEVGRHDANAGRFTGNRDANSMLHLIHREGWAQQGMIDHAGNFFCGEIQSNSAFLNVIRDVGIPAIATARRCIIRRMGKPPLRIASVGEGSADRYLDLDRRYVGGISLNFAVHAKRCGADEVSFLGRLGDDYGERILQELAHEGIDVSHTVLQSGATACQNITLTATRDRVFPPGGYDPGALSGYCLHEDDVRFVQSHNVLATAMFRQVEPLFRQIQSIPFDGWRVADFLDLSDYGKDIAIVERFGEHLTIAFLSGNQELVEQLRAFSRETQCLIVVTLGAEGSLALIHGEPVFQTPAPAQNVLDSTGCGDAFQAAFTVSCWRDGDVRRALHRGAEHAARVLQHYGAIGAAL